MFITILLGVSAVFDICTKRVPPVLQCLFISAVFLHGGVNRGQLILSALVFVCFTGVALLSGGVGGADTKITTLVSLCCKPAQVYFIVFFSFALIFLFGGLHKLLKKSVVSLPYIPFLAVAYTITIL